MKFIETIFSYDQGLMTDCKRNGVIKEERNTINVEHIVSVNEWKGTLLHEGRIGTEVIDINGKKHLDEREYDDFVVLLKNI